MSASRLILLGLLAAASLSATDIRSYRVRLETAADGTGKGTAEVGLARCTAGRINLPLGFKAIAGLQLEEAPPRLHLTQGPSNGQVLLHADLPDGIPADCTFRFTFTLPAAFVPIEPGPGEKSPFPAGSRLFRHALVATQEGTIGSYRFEVLFPPGTRAQAVREQLPKPGKAEAGPRVRLGKADGRQNAVLQMSAMKQGDDTSMALELVPERKSWAWLLAGLALCAIYLFRFRDLVAPRRD